MAIRKDAKADIKDSAPAAEQSERSTGPSVTRQDAAFPAVQPSTVVNIALHSLLMVTVPFALFFTAHFGGLDSLFELTGRQVPSKETKTLLGAGLAVLGVNLVIASFVIAAFREQPLPAKKTE